MNERIVIGINSLSVAMYPAYANHMQNMFKLGRNHQDWDFILCNPPRMAIDRMRNMAAEVALQADAKYLIFIDDDVIIPFDWLERLLKVADEGYDIICGNVQVRGYPFDYMMFRWDDEKRGLNLLKEVPKNQVIPVDAVGFSCALIKVDVLRKVSKPYFITTSNMTEDVTFCLKAQYEYPNVKMACDTGLICGHILWPEIITDTNREAYKEYYETIYPVECASYSQKEKSDRGDSYYNVIKSLVEVPSEA